jgi:hypothetical protein
MPSIPFVSALLGVDFLACATDDSLAGRIDTSDLGSLIKELLDLCY